MNIINSIAGIKSANLIGTKSKAGRSNLAIFNSVVHIGSNPAMAGFIMRPINEVQRHTYENILETGYYTINHVHTSFIEKAHYTAAKFEKELSEFEQCHLEESYLQDFYAPFVKESKVKLGLKYLESVPIKINNTTLVIGEIIHLIMPDEVLSEEGYIDLQKSGDAGVCGLNTYYQLTKLKSFPFARPGELPDFNKS